MIAIFVVRCSDTIPAQNCINKFTFDVGMGWFENWDCGANFFGDIESRNYESEWCKSNVKYVARLKESLTAMKIIIMLDQNGWFDKCQSRTSN